MKSSSILVIVFFISETIVVDGHKDTIKRPSRGLYSNSKMIDNRNVFSPRMDYDEWRPLGRGDPLKNDPTYDYVPPVLETVHYWMEPSKRTPDPPIPNPGVLILGSTRTEPTLTSRFTTNKITTKEPQPDSRIDTMSLLDPFVKLMDGLGLGPGTSNYHRPTQNPNRIQQSYQRPYIHVNKPRLPPQALQRPPYTMLMPPPPPPPSQTVPPFATSTSTTTESDLYNIQYSTAAPIIIPSTNPPTTTTSKPENENNITTIYPTVIVNTENVYKPVAISMPDRNVNETQEEIKNSDLPVPDDGSMVLPIISMFKNHKKVVDPEQNHKHDINEFKENPNPEKHPHEDHLHHHHYSPNSNSVSYPSELDEHYESIRPPSEVMIPPRYEPKPSIWNKEENYRATTARPITTTRKTETLTTDPMFKHYKQPAEPVRGPFYLIIQGHSKVKTYGASKNPINGLLTSNEIKDDDDEDRKSYYDLDSQESLEKPIRESKKLRYETPPEVVEGNPTIEISSSFKVDETKSSAPEESIDHLDSLEETFGKSNGGSSKKRYLANDLINATHSRKRRFIYDDVVNKNRRLLSVEVSTISDQIATISEVPLATKAAEVEISSSTEKISKKKKKKKKPGKIDKKPVKDEEEDPLHVESLIALNDDYNPEDVISLLLKDEGQGSGLGNFVASLFSRSTKENEDM